MWKLSAPERLERWKRFRQGLSEMDHASALDAIAEFWGSAPFVPFYLEYDQPDVWPDPWLLLTENYYCDLAHALGIVYTMYLSEHSGHDVQLRVLSDPETRRQYNLVWIDEGKYVLNFKHHVVVNKQSIPDTLKTLVNYNSTDLKLDRF
jgi:hypothetical protein